MASLLSKIRLLSTAVFLLMFTVSLVLAQTIVLRDEGNSLGTIREINCVGGTIVCSRTGFRGILTLSGVTDHGALTGLTDDDHTQYPLLAGRSGGQTHIGGTGTTDDLILRSTAGVGTTGSDIIFQNGNNGATEAMRIIGANGGVGIGFPAPAAGSSGLDVKGQIRGAPSGATDAITGDFVVVRAAGETGTFTFAQASRGTWTFKNIGAGSVPAHASLGADVSGNFTLLPTNAANVGIGTLTFPSTGTMGLVFGDGTALSSMASNTAGLYANDVAGTVEMFAIGEDGVATQISPHPSDFLATLPVEATGPYAFPWAESSFNSYLGKKIQVDMAGVVKAVEQLTGKQFAFVTDLPPSQRANWDDDQESQRARRQSEIDDANKRRADLDAKIAVERHEGKKADMQKQRDLIVVPPPRVKKLPPKWMRDRGVTSAP